MRLGRRRALTLPGSTLGTGLRASSYDLNPIDARFYTYGTPGTRGNNGVNGEIILLAKYALGYSEVRTKL